MSASRRPFRIETNPRRDRESATTVSTAVHSHLDKIFTELADLRTLMVTVQQSRGDVARVQQGGAQLWEGIESILGAIQKTRTEVSALHSKGSNRAELHRATDELDAVVADTESATEGILSAAERIDATAAKLAARADGPTREALDSLRADAILIFESCNFQDITGQRIRKVVSLMQYIEDRIRNMGEIWQELGAATSDVDEMDEEDSLLNGPALAGDLNVVSQDDIDSLFN
jgi:chemotaxis protein CheZ